MAGVAGALIGLTTGAQVPIGGEAKAIADGTTSSRGCTTNFIGFGKGLSSDEPTPPDFDADDDTVLEANSLAQSFAPTYATEANGRSILTWEDTTPVVTTFAAKAEEPKAAAKTGTQRK